MEFRNGGVPTDGGETILSPQVIKIQVEGGKIFKSHLREVLGVTKYYYSQNLRDIIADREGFDKKYKRYHKRHYITPSIAKDIIQYNLGEDIKVDFI